MLVASHLLFQWQVKAAAMKRVYCLRNTENKVVVDAFVSLKIMEPKQHIMVIQREIHIVFCQNKLKTYTALNSVVIT